MGLAFIIACGSGDESQDRKPSGDAPSKATVPNEETRPEIPLSWGNKFANVESPVQSMRNFFADRRSQRSHLSLPVRVTGEPMNSDLIGVPPRTTVWDSADWKFCTYNDVEQSKANELMLFLKDTLLPYDGGKAYAVAFDGERNRIDRWTFRLAAGKAYLENIDWNLDPRLFGEGPDTESFLLFAKRFFTDSVFYCSRVNYPLPYRALFHTPGGSTWTKHEETIDANEWRRWWEQRTQDIGPAGIGIACFSRVPDSSYRYSESNILPRWGISYYFRPQSGLFRLERVEWFSLDGSDPD